MLKLLALLLAGNLYAAIVSSSGGSVPAGSAGGDLTGSYPNPTVSVITSASNGVFTGTVTVKGAAFSVGTTTMVVVSGRLGMGIAAPTAGIHISRASNLNSDSSITHLKLSAPADTRELALGYDTTNDAAYVQSMQEGNGYKSVGINPDGGNVGVGVKSASTLFQVGSATMAVTVAGNVGIGTLTPCSTCALHVVGSGNFTGDLRQGSVVSCATGVQTDSDGKISACVASDARLKTAIVPLPYSDSAVDLLNPVLYSWRDKIVRDGKRHAGFIAQEVAVIIPQAVVPAGKNTKGIDPNALIAVIVKEVQELRKRLAALEAR